MKATPKLALPEKSLAFTGRVIPTGSLKLDITLGTGGVPRGHITEICGPPSCSKTSLCLHILAEAQKQGGVCAFIDTDHALEPGNARRCGVDVDRLYVCQPKCAEQALEITETLVRCGALAAIAVDSLPGMEPPFESGAYGGEPSLTIKDSLLPQALRRIFSAAQQTHTAVLFTSHKQTRLSKIYHNMAHNTAVLALKLFASLRLDLNPGDLIRENGITTGERVRVRVIKNKFAPSFCTIELDIMYNDGIIKCGEILDLGRQLSIITMQGPDYIYEGRCLGNERKQAITLLQQDLSLSADIEQAIRRKLLPPAVLAVEL